MDLGVDAPLAECLRANGYSQLRRLPGVGVCGVARMIYTAAVFHGMTMDGYKARYCYETLEQAQAAASAWTGAGDPPGPWIVHKGEGVQRVGPGAGAPPQRALPAQRRR